jgi:prepilin-type processing-associated H-X9-DG protein
MAAAAPATAPAAKPDAAALTCARHLRDLVTAAMSYSQDRRGRLPADLGAAWRYLTDGNDPLGPEIAMMYFCASDPAGKALPARITPQWLGQNTSYVFLAPNLPNSIMSRPNLIVAHEKLDLAHDDKVACGFGDGHVEIMAKATAEKRIEASKKQLENVKPLKPRPNERD